MASTAIEWLYGPKDGDVWPSDEPFPGVAVLVGTKIPHTSGYPLLARYLPAEREDTGARALLFDGWYVNRPGDEYGPRTGGAKS